MNQPDDLGPLWPPCERPCPGGADDCPFQSCPMRRDGGGSDPA